MARVKKQWETSEQRVQEMKKASAHDQSEVKDLKVKLRQAEQERDKLSGKQTDAAGLRRALTTAETKQKAALLDMEKRMAELKTAVALEKRRADRAEESTREVSTKAEKDVREAKAKDKELRRRLDDSEEKCKKAEAETKALAQQLERTTKDYEEDRSHIQSRLRQVTDLYGHLASTTIPKVDHEEALFENTRLNLRVVRLQRKLANTEDQVNELALLLRQLQASNEQIEGELHDATFTIEWLSSTALDESEAREIGQAEADDFSISAESTRLDHEAQEVLWSLLRDTHGVNTTQAQKMLSCIRVAERDMGTLEDQIQEGNDDLFKAQEDISCLKGMVDTAKQENVRLVQESTRKSADIAALERQVQDKEATLKAAESRSRIELTKREDLLAREREVTARLSTTVQKSKMAEDALRAEVDQ